MSWFHLIYIPQYAPLIFDEYACNLCETKFSDRISQVSLYGEQPKPNFDEKYVLFILIFGINCLLIVFVFLQPSPVVHIKFSHISQPKNPCSYDWNIYKNTLLLDLISPIFPDMSYFFWRKMSVIINYKLRFFRSIVRCCMWSICLYGTKISIYYHILCSLSRTKPLANSILNIHNIIRNEDCFKLMFPPHRYCNTKYINIWFTTNLKV